LRSAQALSEAKVSSQWSRGILKACTTHRHISTKGPTTGVICCISGNTSVPTLFLVASALHLLFPGRTERGSSYLACRWVSDSILSCLFVAVVVVHQTQMASLVGVAIQFLEEVMTISQRLTNVACLIAKQERETHVPLPRNSGPPGTRTDTRPA
jgi:hypothetical protein